MITKIVSLDQLRTRAEELRANGKKLVATNGCFDLLHAGHVRYLQAARALGDALVVGVNGDDAARQLKGPGRPLNPERDRAEVLAALACVDWVAIFHDTRAVRFLESAAPAVYVKGGDYTIEILDKAERAALQKIGSDIRIIPFEKGYSTSGLIERFCKGE